MTVIRPVIIVVGLLALMLLLFAAWVGVARMIGYLAGTAPPESVAFVVLATLAWLVFCAWAVIQFEETLSPAGVVAGAGVALILNGFMIGFWLAAAWVGWFLLGLFVLSVVLELLHERRKKRRAKSS